MGKQRPDKGEKPRIVTEKKRAASAKNIRDYREKLGRSPHEKHGIALVIRSKGKEMPAIPEAAEIRETVSALIDAAVIDLGGPECVTASQRAILESQRLCLTILALGARYLSAEGIVDRKSKKPQGLLAVLGVYMNGVRLNSLALGLERKAKFGGTLESRLQQIAEREQAEVESVSDSEKSDDETQPQN